MAAFLSPDWLQAQRDAGVGLQAQPGVSATVEHVVTGTPDGNVVYTATYQDGRLTEVVVGKATDPDLVFTATYDGARRLARGDVEPSAAFMQGGLKVEGTMAKLLPLLERMHRPDHRRMVVAVAAETDF